MTATAKPKIDWEKPVQASYGDGRWLPARVALTDLKDKEGRTILLAIEHAPGDEVAVYVRPDLDGGCAPLVRNTPAPPVPFEESRWMNATVTTQGIVLLGIDTYRSRNQAASYCCTGYTPVPVTIRGEWKDGDNG